MWEMVEQVRDDIRTFRSSDPTSAAHTATLRAGGTKRSWLVAGRVARNWGTSATTTFE